MSHTDATQVQGNKSFWARNKWRISGPFLSAGIGAGACAAAMAYGLQGTMTSVCAWMSSLVPAAAGFKFAATVAGAAIAGSLIGLAVGLGVLALYSIYKCCKGSKKSESSGSANSRNAGAAVASGQATVFVHRGDNGGSGAPLPGVDLLGGTI